MDELQLINYRETSKFNSWVEQYTNNPQTRGNATKSAIIAYNYDPIRQYNLASVVGSKNIRKYKILAITYLDLQGLGFGYLMKIGIEKMIEGDFDDWLNMMDLLGYR